MTPLTITVNLTAPGHGAPLPPAGGYIHPDPARGFVVGGIPQGMASGAPSVAIIIPLPDGSVVFAETSLALFVSAADVLRAAYAPPSTLSNENPPTALTSLQQATIELNALTCTTPGALISAVLAAHPELANGRGGVLKFVDDICMAYCARGAAPPK